MTTTETSAEGTATDNLVVQVMGGVNIHSIVPLGDPITVTADDEHTCFEIGEAIHRTFQVLPYYRPFLFAMSKGGGPIWDLHTAEKVTARPPIPPRIEIHSGPDQHGRHRYRLCRWVNYSPGHPEGEHGWRERGQEFFGELPDWADDPERVTTKEI